MAPVEAGVTENNLLPLASLALKPLVIIGIIIGIASKISHVANKRPPAQDTRVRRSRRRRNVKIFLALMLSSLTVISYFATIWQMLSYRLWEYCESRIEMPDSLWSGWLEEGGSAYQLQLSRWSQYQNLHKEVDEITLLTHKGLWWTQAQLSGLVTWSIFVGIEGLKLDISKKMLVAFVLLAQLSGLSVAQNLFFITLLLWPIPLHQQSTSHRDPLWTPHPAVYIVPAMLTFFLASLFPTIAAAPSARQLLYAFYYLVPQVLVLAAKLTPTNFGRMHKDTHTAHRSYKTVFYWLSALSFLLYAQQTYAVLYDSSAYAGSHRYDVIRNSYRKMQARRQWRSRDTLKAAIDSLFHSLSEDPAVSLTGWDAIISALSLGAWAFSRGLNIGHMLECSAIPWLHPTSAEDTVQPEEEKIERNDVKGTVVVEEPSSLPSMRRGRGRPRKSENGKAARSTKAGTPKNKAGGQVTEQESDHGDAYVPSPSVKRDVARLEHDAVREDDDLIDDAEAAALTWGLFVVAGLGTASASVLGAEVEG